MHLFMSCLALICLSSFEALGKTVVEWDFSHGLLGWAGNQYVEDLTWSRRGLTLRSTGIDPWIEGPAVDLPGDRITKVTVRMKSNANPNGELFYGRTFRAGHSVRFTVLNDNHWHDYELIIHEYLGSGTRFRLDPASSEGDIAVAFIKVETIAKVPEVPVEKPSRPENVNGTPVSVSSGPLSIEHYTGRLGNFAMIVNGAEMAGGYQSELIGISFNDESEWLNLKNTQADVRIGEQGQLAVSATIKDSRGGTWQIRRDMSPGAYSGTIVLQSQFEVDADRDVILLPWLTTFPGLGTYGERKYQGLLAGLEYLCDEPSSSQADITTPDHIRRVPDQIKVTFPLAAIAHDGRYIGLIWEPSPWTNPIFDSPDRIFQSGAHVMAVTGPAVGTLRFENDLVAHTPVKLAANETVKTKVWIIGGQGKTIIPAIQQYVNIMGVPGVPESDNGFEGAVTLLAHGWLHSDIRQDGLFRHAIWRDKFSAGPAADAPMFMDWLATSLAPGQKDLLQQLLSVRDQALSQVPRHYALTGGVSHVKHPTPPLVFGNIYAYVQKTQDSALSALNRFVPNGTKPYTPKEVDYGKTHFTNHANGFGGGDLVRILQAASLSADEGLVREALGLLDKQKLLYADTIPRGAQTWEIPLHTPDILAAAHMVNAYTFGYVLSGDEDYLRQACYWAWTGLPFVYLRDPTPAPLGRYATVPVFGATNWRGSWFGRPVQWCGLVYGSALHFLSEHDQQGPWRQIAKGVTAAGLHMSWPLEDEHRQGLLPDYIHLRAQVRAGPAINPGTVQAHVPELFDRGKIYDVKPLNVTGWLIHAPCAIHNIIEQTDLVKFTLDGWGGIHHNRPYFVLLSGVTTKPAAVYKCTLSEDSEDKREYTPADIEYSAGADLMTLRLAKPTEILIYLSSENR